ncbi:MAG: S1 RNA-binding domain-containing protein, partial [Planctomycetes bacterium]|nr:S1 RNA-binding domain-containing protein [Planctomycetota bacterium]
VSGVNKGGVKVDLGGIQAFCPISQLELSYVPDASVYLQKTLRFTITEIKGDRDVVLSRRPILAAERDRKREEIAGGLAVGARVSGTVVRVVDFGAFVDLGGIDGLIPTRELTYGRKRPEQVVSTGQRVEVIIQEITRKGSEMKITLSLKALDDDPWSAVHSVAAPGSVIAGTVRK